MIDHNNPTLGKDEIKAIHKVINSKWIAQGIAVQQFENSICDFIGLPKNRGIALSNGTSSLFVAFKVLELKEKDEIILPTYTCSALLNAIYMANLMPVLVDISPIDFNISLEDLKTKITSRTKAILVTHTFGVPMDLPKLLKFNIPIIEDCAVSLGSKIKNKYAGNFGICSTFSFYASKIMTCGTGGMFISKNNNLVKKAKDYRDFDGVKNYYPRFNFQMNDIQAAVGLMQFAKLREFLQLRKSISRNYTEICNTKGWDYQKPLENYLYPNWFRFVVKINKKDILNLKNYLEKKGIKTVVPISQETLLHNYLKLNSRHFPVSEKISQETLSLPIYPGIILSNSLNTIIKILKHF